MNTTGAPTSAHRSPLLRYISILRLRDILVLQGSPLIGAVFAIGHPETDDFHRLAILLAGNVFLMAHVFMLNDWAGLTPDLADPHKAAGVFTTRGVGAREVRVLAAALLVLSLLLFSRLGALPVALALGIAFLSALYSLPRFDWKGRPFLNSVAHLAGGVAHFLLGYSVGNAIDGRGIAMATFFALIFAAGHLTQEIRDYEGDARNAIRTNAVIFGRRRAFVASLVLFTLAHILFLLLTIAATLPRPLAAVILLFPLQLYWSFNTLRDGLTFGNVSRLQTRYRALYAVIGVAMVAALFVW